MSLQITLKFGLHQSTSTNFASKWPATFWFEHWRHSMANCGQMVR